MIIIISEINDASTFKVKMETASKLAMEWNVHNWIPQSVHNGETGPYHIFFTDKTCSHGEVNSQNRYWMDYFSIQDQYTRYH
jgi:hypothetical protein